MKAFCLVFLTLCTALQLFAAQGRIVLLNGTSSAGKSSLAEAMVQQSKTKYEVISFDDFRASYTRKQQLQGWGYRQYNELMTALYRHVKAEADAGNNVIIDTVEFDRGYDTYCRILDCTKVIKVIVYCPPEHLMKRIEKRNSGDDPANRRSVLLSFDQFVQMYQPQTSTNQLVVARVNTRVLREALIEAGQKSPETRRYQMVSNDYVKVFGIDKDRDITIVPKGQYDLVVNTKADTKKKNIVILDDYVKSRGR